MTAGRKRQACVRNCASGFAMEMDGGEEQFFVDSKPIEVCRVARGKRCKDGACRQFLASSRLRLLCFAEHVLFWL